MLSNQERHDRLRPSPQLHMMAKSALMQLSQASSQINLFQDFVFVCDAEYSMAHFSRNDCYSPKYFWNFLILGCNFTETQACSQRVRDSEMLSHWPSTISRRET